MNNDLEFKINAAKKALGICNKLKPGPFKAKHVSRIFKNLNKLRKLRVRLL